MAKKTNMDLLNVVNPESFNSRHSLLKRNFMNVILLESELFMIRLGLPIDSYFSGCLVSNILNSR